MGAPLGWSEFADIATVLGIPFILGGLAFQALEIFPRRWERSRREFLTNRDFYRQTQIRLGRIADQVFQGRQQQPHHPWPDLPLFALTGWVPAAPQPLDSVRCQFFPPLTGADRNKTMELGTTENAKAAALARRRLARTWPKDGLGKRFGTYHETIEALDRPQLFDDLPSYRALDVLVADGDYTLQLSCAPTYYFDYLDSGDVLGLELAGAVKALPRAVRDALLRQAEAKASSLRLHLPYRKSLMDPFDFRNRCAIPAVSALTLRARQNGYTFFMHHRGKRAVAVAGDVYHVAPAAQFQPSSDDPTSFEEDRDLWLNIMREYDEEFLGHEAAKGRSGRKIDRTRDEPYRSLDRAKRNGAARAYFVGFVIEPLTWTLNVLTIVVINDREFDRIFGSNLVRENEEGIMMVGKNKEGLELTAEEVARYEGDRTLPLAIALLRTALSNKDLFRVRARSGT